MRKETTRRMIEVTTYYSDDGAFSSRNKEEVEDYELKAKCLVHRIDTLDLLDNKGNNVTYAIYKLKSRDDLNFLINAYEAAYGKFMLSVDGWIKQEFPLPADEYFASEYFVVYYHTGLQRYKLSPINDLYKQVKSAIIQDRRKVTLEESALTFLEELKNE